MTFVNHHELCNIDTNIFLDPLRGGPMNSSRTCGWVVCDNYLIREVVCNEISNLYCAVRQSI